MGGTVGKRLAGLRKARGWTQPEVAERLGVTRVSVSNHERASTMPDEAVLERYAALYGVSVEALRYGERAVNPPTTAGLSEFTRGVLHAAHRMSATVTALIEEVMSQTTAAPAPSGGAPVDVRTLGEEGMVQAPTPPLAATDAERRAVNGRRDR
jgi:transcriptional regulator with XRE-family HTH domain